MPSDLRQKIPQGTGLTIVFNKTDLSGERDRIVEKDSCTQIFLSAKEGKGIQLLRQHLKQCMGYERHTEGQFIARRRHISAINNASNHLNAATQCLQNNDGELLAEELKLSQQELSSITGDFTSDDLLGRIFSDFCIGK
jgi:tRNA modification GTPase